MQNRRGGSRAAAARDCRLPGGAARLVLACLLALTGLLLASGWGACVPAQALDKGAIDYRLEMPASIDLGAVPGMIDTMGPEGLNARWTRIMVHWKRLQPYAPGVPYAGDANGDGYDDGYVRELDTIIGGFAASGVKVILTPLDVPEWASDQSLWNSPPKGYERGYQPFYAMDVANPTALSEFGRMGQFLAARYAGAARYLEVWNEPNLGLYLYPQNPKGHKHLGPWVYLQMLRAFSAGVHRGAADAVVIGGATSPSGFNNVSGTSPQAFARYLKRHHATRYFEAYSHHPYGSRDDRCVTPSGRPNAPDWEVTLYNLNVLLKLFPHVPFYLTEYGYNSRSLQLFGPAVSRAKQAQYLRNAYRLVARRYPRVKAMLWFVVQDMPASAPGARGCYMGLQNAQGVRKPAWYAFAGGTSIAVWAPRSAPRARRFNLKGLLSSRVAGGPGSVRVQLQVRHGKSRRWRVIATRRTRADGSFYFRVSQRISRVYRVAWDGVAESHPRRVVTVRR